MPIFGRTTPWPVAESRAQLRVLTPALSDAQQVWSVDLGYERSAVTDQGQKLIRDTARVQAGRVAAATGYRRLGDWTIAGGLAAEFESPSFAQRTVALTYWRTF